jgi:adenylate cyclase class 2
VSFVDGRGDIERILEAMEFVAVSSYERYQTKWEVDGVVVTIDEYPFGVFVELEGNLSMIAELAERLAFDVDEALVEAIDTLFTEWRRNRGLEFKAEMRFEDFDG